MGNKLGKKKKAQVLVLGLDNSGKTTIIRYLQSKHGQSVGETVPTVGYQQEAFLKNKVQFTAFDMSGQAKYRCLWDYYYKQVDCIIFVIDASDKMRLVVAKDELDALLAHPGMLLGMVCHNADMVASSCPILFLANKIDIRDSMEPVESTWLYGTCSLAVAQTLSLEAISNKPWYIKGTNALSGEGIDDGVSWLCERI